MDLLAEPDVRDVLQRARQLHVAVAATAGPHVTPELYAVDGGRVWFWTAHTTLKAKVIADDHRASVTARAGDRCVVLAGAAVRVDPREVRRLPDAARATLGFGLRNAADLAGFANDFVRGRLGRSLPPRRVLVELRPTLAAVLDASTISGGDQEAVVAWETENGPLALPARVSGALTRAWIPRSLDGIPALPSPARVAVVVDRYVAPGPAAKEGTLVRGTGTLDADGCVEIAPERETVWRGVDTSTRRVDDD